MSDTQRWNIQDVRTHLGAASVKSASRTLSRLGVKAIAYERGATGRPQAWFDADEVRAATSGRPGRGRRAAISQKPGAAPDDALQ